VIPAWKRFARSGFLLLAALGLAGCLTDGASRGTHPPPAPPGWPEIRWPADDPYDPAKAALGKVLFLETRLSRNASVSCAWCHDPTVGFADKHASAFSTGVNGVPTRRNSPTLTNVGYGTSFMLDGRIATLEDQALGPLLSKDEMDMTGPEIEARLASDTAYVRMFDEVFGPGGVTLPNVTRALATYERTLVSARSPYDRWAAGDSTALDAPARRGAAIFLGERGGCFRCHTPPLFTDKGFHDIGLDTIPSDSGRFAVTGLAADIGKFKTPTLRNAQQTAPYMHDGRFGDLENVVRNYNAGGAPDPNRDPRIHPLGLSDGEVLDLVAFLQSLSDPVFTNQQAP
jgi:cytochrome c peroxidase